MEKLSDLLEMAKVSDIITKKEKEDNKIVWVLAIIGAIAAVAGIAFAVYKYPNRQKFARPIWCARRLALRL